MKRIIFVFAVLLTICILTPNSGQALVLFDNGSYSGSQVARFNSGSWTMFEDFTLTSPGTITGIQWGQHDQPISYSSTLLTFYSGVPSGGNQTFSTTTGATRTPNATGIIFTNYSGFDYEISGLSINLSPGTYWFGLHNNVSGGMTSWDETVGNASTIPGRYQTGSALPGDWHPSEDSVFKIIGTTSVPEPATLLLLGSGLVGLGLFRKKFKKR